MKVSKEEILHIADLADLIIEEDKIEKYAENLEEILNFANVVNEANTDELDITIGANEKKNVFRKDEIKVFDNREGLMENAPAKSQNMFEVPNVL